MHRFSPSFFKGFNKMETPRDKHLWELSYDESVGIVRRWLETVDESGLQSVVRNTVQIALVNRGEKTARVLLRQIMLQQPVNSGGVDAKGIS